MKQTITEEMNTSTLAKKENEPACKREKESVNGEDENQPIYIDPDKITHKKMTGRYPWGERRNESDEGL